MIDLDELQRIASAATAGPWFWSEENSQGATVMGRMLTKNGETIFDFGDCTRYYPTEGTEPDAADVLFMQAANPSVILDLIGIARAAADSLPKIKEGSPAPAETRQQFEAWARKAEPPYHIDWNGSARRAQRYYVDRTQHAYEGFCAALALSGAAPASQAAAPAAELKKERDQFERMLWDACGDLGLINEELGLDPDDGGAEPILEAIRELKAALAGAAPVEAAKKGMRITLTGDMYPVEVWAESCMEGEFQPHTFALHHFLAPENMLDVTEFVVTHLETGWSIARGESIEAATALARERLKSITPEEFAERCANAKKGIAPPIARIVAAPAPEAPK